MRCLQLPFTFDIEQLRDDLARVAPGEWIPHVNRAHYDGRWSGAALRSLGGSATNLVPEARGAEEFRDTALLARCPYFRTVLATFRCPLLAVRLLRLHAGSHIAEHVDQTLDFEDGEVRIHIPIVTSDDVKFHLDGERLVMAPGECWYTNVNLPHSVENSGLTDRIHLVLDCRVDDWLRGIFRTAPRPPRTHHAATLRAPSAPEASALLGVFSEFAAAPRSGATRPVLRAAGNTICLSWPGAHTWQIRLAPADTPVGAGWSAALESSPDTPGLHAGDFAALLAALRAAFPDWSLAPAAP